MAESSIYPRESDQYPLKVIILGEPDVGKTSIMLGAFKKNFYGVYKKTLGYPCSRLMAIDVSGVTVKLEARDVLHGWRHVFPGFFTGVVAAVLVFDLTQKSSFDHIQHWRQQVQEHAGQDVDLILVGNKVDLAKSRVIDHETANSLAQTIGAMYVECSVARRINVDLVFTLLAGKMAARVPVQPEEPVLSGFEPFGKDTCYIF